MRLFHVSEEPNIIIFEPRAPERDDLDKNNKLNVRLYVYEFNTKNFALQDETAGYYVSTEPELPINVRRVDNIFSELFKYKFRHREKQPIDKD